MTKATWNSFTQPPLKFVIFISHHLLKVVQVIGFFPPYLPCVKQVVQTFFFFVDNSKETL
jgi:hypothetical protein